MFGYFFNWALLRGVPPLFREILAVMVVVMVTSVPRRLVEMGQCRCRPHSLKGQDLQRLSHLVVVLIFRVVRLFTGIPAQHFATATRDN